MKTYLHLISGAALSPVQGLVIVSSARTHGHISVKWETCNIVYSHYLLYREGNNDYITTHANSTKIVAKIKLLSFSFMEAIAKLRLLDPSTQSMSLIFMIQSSCADALIRLFIVALSISKLS